MIVANDVSRPDSGFDTDTNSGIIISAAGEQPLPLSSKKAMAERIFDELSLLRKTRSEVEAPVA